MDDDEMMYREMNEDDPWYMGDDPTIDPDLDEYVYTGVNHYGMDYEGKGQQDGDAVFFLFWNPDDSSYTMERFTQDYNKFCRGGGGMCMDWTVFNNVGDVRVGAKYYMVRVGMGFTGVIWHGEFVSEPYYDMKSDCDYARIECRDVVKPNGKPLMSLRELRTIYPTYDFKNAVCGDRFEVNYPDELRDRWLAKRQPRPVSQSQPKSQPQYNPDLKTSCLGVVAVMALFGLGWFLLWLLMELLG